MKIRIRKKYRRLMAISVILIVVISLGIMFLANSELRFKIKDSLGIGKKEVVITSVSLSDIDTKKVLISDFIIRDNVAYNQSMMLVNSEHRIADDFEADTAEYKNTGVIMNSCMRDDYSDMSLDIIDKFNNTLYIMSSYRTAEEQDEIYNEQSEDSAMKAGYSEHQTGLALDVYIKDYAGEGFIKSDVGQWVNENSWKYGFIIRYPQNKNDITGIKFEPWHIRYVGFPHSEIIYKNSITLEEHIESMKIGKFYEFDGYIYTRQKGEEITIPSGFKSYVISEDNTGCFIITGKR